MGNFERGGEGDWEKESRAKKRERAVNKKEVGKCSEWLWRDDYILEGEGVKSWGGLYCPKCISRWRFLIKFLLFSLLTIFVIIVIIVVIRRIV